MERNFIKKKRYDWGKFPKRYEILQEIINLKKYKSYLEIGCDRNQSFSNIKIERPYYTEKNGCRNVLTPNVARLRKDTYSLKVIVDISVKTLTDESSVINVIQNIVLCKIHTIYLYLQNKKYQMYKLQFLGFLQLELRV